MHKPESRFYLEIHNQSHHQKILNLNHLCSLEPGDNYIFHQEPIAFWFTAYINNAVEIL